MKNTKRILSLVLVLALILTPILMGISTATAISGPVGDVIFNYPYDNSTPPTALKDIDWDKVDHNLNDGILQGNEQAYTEERSELYNGYVTPDHVVLKDANISLYGYGQMGYLDYVFHESVFRSYGNSFIMNPTWMNFHTFPRQVIFSTAL